MKDYPKNQIELQAEGNKKTYRGIDVCKLLCAILVVVLHAIESSSWYANEVKFVFTRFAVPFFFIASGFFFTLRLEHAEDKKKYFIHYEKRIIITYFIWACVIYLPFEIMSYISNNPESSFLKIVLLLVRRYLFIGPGPYWYLLALFLSIAFLFFCQAHKLDKLLIFFSIFGMTVEIAYTGFRDVLSQYSIFNLAFKGIYFLFSFEFNFIMFGIPFVSVGYYIAQNNITWAKGKSVIIFLIATVGRFIEYNLPILNRDPNGAQFSVCFIFQAIALFLLAKEVHCKSLKTDVFRTIRQLSSTIYFIHSIILYEILNPIITSLTKLPVYADWMIAPKVIITLVLSCLFYYAIRKIDNRHLNYLING